MNFVRWNSLGDMSLIQNQMNRLFDSALHGWTADPNGTTVWIPTADIYESETDLVVHLDVPGVDPRLIHIQVEKNVLTIRGERPFEDQKNSESFHRIERSYGTFGRSFSLSTAVDPDKIRATYNAGVLTITLPKTEAAKPRKIQIAAAVA